MAYIGIDIGGTKCAVVRGVGTNIQRKVRFETADFDSTLKMIFDQVEDMMDDDIEAIGVSCGGPLDSGRGVIMSPPNLPGWDDVRITEMLTERFSRPAYLCNDADASALAEWRYGAGVGAWNMAFLTFGTGLGAGLILDGKLYTGACGMAGEIGHVRLYDRGHIGYGKRGSAEGYCSGGGIAQYGLGTAKELAERAEKGDGEALAVYSKVGEDLGKTLAILIDVLNLDTVVIGSIYARSRELIEPSMRRVLEREALAQSVAACRILPAGLLENIGDVAALCVAEMGGGKVLYRNYPELSDIKEDVDRVVSACVECYKSGGKILIAGNGGSAADAEHIVGELMKGFKLMRPVSDERIPEALAGKLQGSLPALCLSGGVALPTAYANDVDGEYTVAQNLYGLGKAGDIFIAISTSGNAKNLCHAAELAKCLGIKTVAMTGETGGRLSGLCDITLKMPSRETYRVQEYHLPVYHHICAEIESALFEK